MTFEQDQHLTKIQTEFSRMVFWKYRQGAKEHGGNLIDMTPLQLLDNAIDECIDQFTYLITLRDKLANPK